MVTVLPSMDNPPAKPLAVLPLMVLSLIATSLSKKRAPPMAARLSLPLMVEPLRMLTVDL